MAYSYTTEALYSGEHVRGMDMTPETIPCFMTTAFTMSSDRMRNCIKGAMNI